MTQCRLHKTFTNILEQFGPGIPEDLYLSLQSFATLLQESTSSELITKKAIKVVAQRMEEKVEASLEKGMEKMSSLAKNLSVNQRELQASSVSLNSMAETLQKVAKDIDHSTKEAKDTSSQLTSSISTYKGALLSLGNTNTATPAHAGTRTQEVPRLTRELDCKQCQILIEFDKSFTDDRSGLDLKEKIENMLKESTPPHWRAQKCRKSTS